MLLPVRLDGLGERRELPSRVQGGAVAEKWILWKKNVMFIDNTSDTNESQKNQLKATDRALYYEILILAWLL